MHVVEKITRMTKAKLAGLDGKRNEPIFPRKHTEPAGEVSTEAPATSGSFKPARGFRRKDYVVGSTKNAMN